MIFTIASNPQAPGLDRGKAKTDRLSKGCSIDMGDPVLIADPAVREVEALARDISVWIGGVVGVEPEKMG
jgi:hypothetical protein